MSASADIKRRFEQITLNIQSAEAMRRLGTYIINSIRRRTREEGKGVSQPGGTARNLRRVTTKYAKWRMTQPRHPEAARGTRSNLTFSGKMLDSLIIKRATATSLFIGFKTQKEADKSQYQEEQGRRFLVLSGKEIRDAASFVKSMLKAR